MAPRTHNSTDRREAMAHLARRLRRWERVGRGSRWERGSWLTGVAALDALLPAGGVRPGMLLEWFAAEEGSGGGSLLLLSAMRLIGVRGRLVLIDPGAQWYPPAAVRLGVDLQRTVVVRPAAERDMFWVLEQALGCPGVTVVVCWLKEIHERTFRRLQLAAERGGSVGMLARPARFCRQPSWADARFHVRPLPGSATGRRLHLERLRCRGEFAGRSMELELNDETGAVYLVAELGAAEVAARAAGA